MQPRRVIAEYLEKSDCFALVSNQETFGVAYIEALAVGIPVIATKCGGPEDFVNESNGIMISVDDVDALVEAMREMHDHSDQYDSVSISRDIRNRYSPKLISDSLLAEYKRLIDKNRSETN